jgi:hypothetical protein
MNYQFTRGDIVPYIAAGIVLTRFKAGPFLREDFQSTIVAKHLLGNISSKLIIPLKAESQAKLEQTDGFGFWP